MSEKRFIEQFEENVQKYPDKVILRDEHNSLTFRELDELSGRVYAYLKEKGIGREDFVMIGLPHSCLVYAVMIGVWRAGAAFVVTGEGLPIERSNYVYKECGCRCYFGEKELLLIQKTSPKLGHEATDVHDVAYAVYTSGSEGVPKGSLIEYGFLEFFAQTALNTSLIRVKDDTTYFMPVPMFTVGAVNTCIQIVWSAITVDIGPLGIMRDVKAFEEYLNEHRINVAFMPPSYYKNYTISTPYLECVILTSERASNVYATHCKLLNTYTQTEGYHLCWFEIDKPYENTPIGKPVSEKVHISLLDDEGNEVSRGEIGELCFERRFFRGYVGESQSDIDNSCWQHSGDIARINEDGNYVILGRKSDMIKINGNRIEPAEIEAAVKRVLNIDWAFAKGFVEPERSFICVYYTADIQIDYAAVREELMRVLPTYMIPSYFVHLDEVPHLPNGKVDRRALKAPDIEQYRAPYVAPENELEERICAEMEKVLALGDNETRDEKSSGIGANDDFYLLGGDSLRTIELVTNLDIEDLSVADIYAARTPRAIVERWMQKQILVNCDSCDKN